MAQIKICLHWTDGISQTFSKHHGALCILISTMPVLFQSAYHLEISKKSIIEFDFNTNILFIKV